MTFKFNSEWAYEAAKDFFKDQGIDASERDVNNLAVLLKLAYANGMASVVEIFGPEQG